MRTFVIEAWSSQGAPAEPTRRAIDSKFAARVIRLAGALAFGIGGAFWLAHGLHRVPTVLPAASETSQPVWRDLDKPAPRYTLEAPGFSAAAPVYAARLHVAGGGREDMLSLGALDGAAPALRLRIYRDAAETPSRTPLFAALAHEAARAGLSVEHSGLAEILPTRFGRFEIADVVLAGPGASAERRCSGFRLIRDEPVLSITGLACGGAQALMARPAVSCLIDGLDLTARDDQELVDFFARVALDKDPACPAMHVAEKVATTEDQNPGKTATSRKSLRRR